MNNNKLLSLIEHFLYSVSVVGIGRSNFNLYLYEDKFTVELAQESDLGCWVDYHASQDDLCYDIKDKQSSQESVDKIEKLYKMFKDYYDL